MEKNALVFAKKIKIRMNKQILPDIFMLFAHRFNIVNGYYFFIHFNLLFN